MEDAIASVGFFLAAVAIVMIVVVAGVVNRFNMHETVREALRQGKTLDAEAIKALGAPRRKSGNNDLKAGLILLAVAAGLVALGALVGTALPDEPDVPPMMNMMAGVAAIPAFIGLVLTGFGVVSALRPPKQED
ncbi:hypothetical protein AB6B38_00785 [Glycocaulis abyssi]|uniref:Uncharacterized protein n=1 Tax=Glycocaulis abyssi TaxID=1433403 RepID=A0ABV9ND39_9PROT